MYIISPSINDLQSFESYTKSSLSVGCFAVLNGYLFMLSNFFRLVVFYLIPAKSVPVSWSGLFLLFPLKATIANKYKYKLSQTLTSVYTHTSLKFLLICLFN